MPAIAEARSAQSQEPETPCESSSWTAGIQVFEPLSAASRLALVGNFILKQTLQYAMSAPNAMT